MRTRCPPDDIGTKPEDKSVFKKVLLAVAITAAMATLPAAPASAATEVTITTELRHTSTVKESAGVAFTCPANEVLTGRRHSGDENGYTTYYCSRVLVNGEQALVSPGSWTSGQRESSSFYEAPADLALVGRWHSGDENGTTRYRTGALYWQGQQLRLAAYVWTGNLRESGHFSQGTPGEVMVGRAHWGDENGDTRYRYATVIVG
jgi:curli biogenesis system outer membrane secretion channel CsgG